MNYCTGYLDRENPQVVFKSLLCTTWLCFNFGVFQSGEAI
jgi:hypothetical protein